MLQKLKTLTAHLPSPTSVGGMRAYKAVNEPILLYAAGSSERDQLDKALTHMQSSVPFEVPICIGAERLTSDAKQTQVYPFDHKKSLANYYWATENQISQAIDVALAAKKTWSRTPFEERAKIFLKAADLICKKHRFNILASTILGQGKTIYQAEIDAAAELADFLRFNVQFASEALQYKPINTPDASNRMIYRPTEGFWAALPPFNFTAIAGNLASAPALMGNVVLWKPSDSSLYSNYLVYQVLLEAGLPAGVISFIPCDGPSFGNVIMKHPQLAGINFTGRTVTFRHLLKNISANLEVYKTYPRAIGECGGKNFHFVHPSADVEAAALGTIRSAFEYSGQKCSACSRLYVPQSLWPKMKELLCEHHSQLKIASPLETDTFSSAVINKVGYDTNAGYIAYAMNSPDLTLVAGGDCNDSTGYFIHPTIFETKNPRDKMMTDDIFGPIVTVYVYDDAKVDETLDLVDETSDYGLTGAIFAQDGDFITKASDRLLDCVGNFYVNVQSTGSVVGNQPFGGARLSGTNDKAGGPHYVLRFTSPVAIKTQQKPITTWKQMHMQ